MKQLTGIHHVTAITSSSQKIYDFYTNILGLRLVKKSINQDDIKTYHLFFADDKGTPGTDITFFDFEGIDQAVHGTNEISRTSFRVPNDEALAYWIKRFNHYHVKQEAVKEIFGAKVVFFEDFDQQPYALFSDEHDNGVESGTPWLKGPVPNEYGITGLGPIFLSVNQLDRMDKALKDIFLMRKTDQQDNLHLYEMGLGGHGGSVILKEDDNHLRSYQGYGGVHHVAFRVDSRETLDLWSERFDSLGLRHSGYVDRFYFESLYIRVYPGILFELATDEPGFIDDEESYEILGETLALPPKYRAHKDYIEKLIKPLDTIRSTKTFQKEYHD